MSGDRFLETGGMICGIYRLARGLPNFIKATKYLDGQIHIISDLLNRKNKLISGLVADTDAGWKQCDYIVHALVWGLREEDCTKVLSNMSDDKIALFKDAISIAKEKQKPSEEDVITANKISDIYYKRNSSSTMSITKKVPNTARQYSALMVVVVAEQWDGITQELDKWAVAIENYKHVEKTKRVDHEQKNIHEPVVVEDAKQNSSVVKVDAPETESKIGGQLNSWQKI